MVIGRRGRWARRALAAACLAVVGLLDVAAAQPPTAQIASQLRVEWKRVSESWRRPAIEGFVHNDSVYRVGSVRLRVETLDSDSKVVGESLAWVYGNIPSGGRWGFSIPLPRSGGGENFRLSVESFHLVALEAPRESP